jgi:hypothetical protein
VNLKHIYHKAGRHTVHILWKDLNGPALTEDLTINVTK